MLALIQAPAAAQLQIKSEDATIKFGIQGQLWADWTQDATAPPAGPQGYQQNLYLRRVRVLMGGDIGHDISFFLETDSPNLGKTPKAATSGFMLQDAFLEWKPTKVFQLDGGLFFVPLSRNALQSTLSYYTVDLSPLTTVNNSSTQSAALRDLGFQARGFLFGRPPAVPGGSDAGRKGCQRPEFPSNRRVSAIRFFRYGDGIRFCGYGSGKEEDPGD